MPGTVEHPVCKVAMLQNREHRLRGIQFRGVWRQSEQGDIVRMTKSFERRQPAPPAMTSACLPSGTFSPISARWRLISPVLARSLTWPIAAPVCRQNAEKR